MKRARLTFLILITAALINPLMSPALSQTSGQARDLKTRINDENGSKIELYDKSFALIIGASDYDSWPDLPGVKQDVREVAAVLKKHEFVVEIIMNPTRGVFDQTVRRFINEYGQSASNRLLIYFAGHGHTLTTHDERELGYIVPVDAPLPQRTNAGPFKQSAISMSEIEVFAQQIEAKHVLFVFDSCFSGSLFEATRAVPDAIASKTARPVRQFITAGTAEQAVPDNSIFRAQFIEALNGEADFNRDGYITGSELGVFLEDKVTNYSRRTQTPRYGKIRDPRLDKGDFVFILPPQPNPPVATVPNSTHSSQMPSVDPIDIEIGAWKKIKNSTNQEDFKNYLAKYPEGIFSDYAKKQIKNIQDSVKAPESSVHEPFPVKEDAVKKMEAGTIANSLSAKPTADFYLAKGDELISKEKWLHAETEYREAVRLEPKRALGHSKLALSLRKQGKYREAENSYKRAILLEPSNALWHYNLGWVLLAQFRLNEAEDSYKKAIKIDPKNPQYDDLLNRIQISKKMEAQRNKGTNNTRKSNGYSDSRLSEIQNEAQRQESNLRRQQGNEQYVKKKQ